MAHVAGSPIIQTYAINPSLLHACAAQNFGIIGNGRQHIFQMGPNGAPVEVAAFDTLDGIYDCAWSEENENVLLAASGDGSIKVYDLGLPPQVQELVLLVYISYQDI